MVSEGASFLPRIQSVFYAVFDLRQGPKIVYQVPEGLISSTSTLGNLLAASSSIPATHAGDSDAGQEATVNANDWGESLASPSATQSTSQSPPRRTASSNRTLFHFEEISRYVIPPTELCGKLVICATKHYRIIGFPVNLRGNYVRNYFRYNLCFVFERAADLSCYEPVVRKVSRVLTACEVEMALLSSPQSSLAIHAILEQLYEDLNSYSETHIAVDNFNSIDLKIFPFYPNPPAVQDWEVPVALINILKGMKSNWDLTVAKVCQYIDGTNHVSRIAHLADCDLDLTRQAISHLLYYQVIMTIDIFQYSNIYTLRKSIQWLADESVVKEQCGPYVTIPGQQVPDWAQLLQWYSRLKLGKTVLEWMGENHVSDAIDVRRLTSFGVIKGFLRRVHRWPVLLPSEQSQNAAAPAPRKRGKSFSSASTRSDHMPPLPEAEGSYQSRSRWPRSTPPGATFRNGVETKGSSAQEFLSAIDGTAPTKRRSAAETVLERLHNMERATSRVRSALGQPRQPSEVRRHPLMTSTSSSLFANVTTLSTAPITSPSPNTALPSVAPIPVKTRPSRSSSVSTVAQSLDYAGGMTPPIPSDFASLLDGEHHTDELATRFEVGWPILQRWLVAVGGGKGDDFGRVVIIYR